MPFENIAMRPFLAALALFTVGVVANSDYTCTVTLKNKNGQQTGTWSTNGATVKVISSCDTL